MMEPEIGYWFFGNRLRDWRPVPPDGAWLVHEGPLVLCRAGLHYSKHPLDALQYAPGPNLAKVEIRGEIIQGEGKSVAQERKILVRADATDMLLACGRKFALDVIHLWRAPELVREYLEAGDYKSLDDISTLYRMSIPTRRGAGREWLAANAARNSWFSVMSGVRYAAWAASHIFWAARYAGHAVIEAAGDDVDARNAAAGIITRAQRDYFQAEVDKLFSSEETRETRPK